VNRHPCPLDSTVLNLPPMEAATSFARSLMFED
jgi:hypothetical protein